MSEIKFNCPHCNQHLSASEEYIGYEVECPGCKKIFICKKQQTENSTVNQRSANGVKNSSFLFVCPECNTKATLPASMRGKNYECLACCETSIAQPATEKRCPYCNGSIKVNAIICKHCKKNITPNAKPQVAPQNNIPQVSTYPHGSQWQGSMQNNFAPNGNFTPNGNFAPNSNFAQPQGSYPYQNNSAVNGNFNPNPNAQNGLNVTIVQQNNKSNGYSFDDSEQKSFWIYLLLAFFLGSLGLHDFYAGYTKHGVIKLVLTLALAWLIVPAIFVCIWTIYDMCTVREDANGVPFC